MRFNPEKLRGKRCKERTPVYEPTHGVVVPIFTEKNRVLVNHNNSKSTRDRHNAARRALHHQQVLDRNDARKELEEIDLTLEQEAEARKTSNQITKDLQEKKKMLQTTSGVKKTKKQGEKERARLPDENEMAGTTESGVSEPFSGGLAVSSSMIEGKSAFLPTTIIMEGNSGFILPPELESMFGGEYGDDLLPGDLDSYL
ncbi:hypothetical protein C8F04DRAFT_1194613 [Mycena alexandri]|uniref:Uncharacterized protein n=1 Tax=Mycena alexandri TaxID=1745969 RepID=A0AAD6WRF9_9AGAR|nr:hypothetical protein C8F04DRAFT_1194613 [Mycena alexandri]